MASKMKIFHKKVHYFTAKIVFIQKKIHGLFEEPNPLSFSVMSQGEQGTAELDANTVLKQTNEL